MNAQSLPAANPFTITDTDMRMIDSARALLRNMIVSRKANPGQLNSISKLLAGLDRLPNVAASEKISVTILTPLTSDTVGQVRQYWEIAQLGQSFRIRGGHMKLGPVSEKVSSLGWSIAPDGGAESQRASNADLAAGVADFQCAVAALSAGELPYEMRVDDAADNIGGLSSWDLAMEVLCMLAVRPRRS